jgi:hypothetical protein
MENLGNFPNFHFNNTIYLRCDYSRASPLFHVKELFSANRESHVRVGKFLPDYVGVPEQLKISVESNKLEIIKEALYIREITILYKHKFYR